MDRSNSDIIHDYVHKFWMKEMIDELKKPSLLTDLLIREYEEKYQKWYSELSRTRKFFHKIGIIRAPSFL